LITFVIAFSISSSHKEKGRKKRSCESKKKMAVDKVIVKQRNIILVGIPIDESGVEVLKWALEEVAKHGDCVVVVHVCFTYCKLFFFSFLFCSFEVTKF